MSRRLHGTTSGSPFRSRFTGRCKGCGHLYKPGEVIFTPGFGRGAYHKRCWDNHSLETRQATPEDLKRLAESRARRGRLP